MRSGPSQALTPVDRRVLLARGPARFDARDFVAALALVLSSSILIGFAPGSTQAQQATSIQVKIDGIKGSEGVVLVVLYDSPDTWLKIGKAAQRVEAKITGSSLSVELKGVKPGTYAVSVIHDENKNGELDMRWLPYPKPKEGSGASGSAEGSKVGPPKWETAKFAVSAEGKTVSVTLKYP